MIFDEQARLRENLKALGAKETKSEKMLREKYINKFDERESELEKIELQIATDKEKLKEINEEIRNIDGDWQEKQLLLANQAKNKAAKNVNKKKPVSKKK